MAEATRIRISATKIAKVFEEWDRRWRANPNDFVDVVTHLTKDTPLTYGESCAPYFIKLASELGKV